MTELGVSGEEALEVRIGEEHLLVEFRVTSEELCREGLRVKDLGIEGTVIVKGREGELAFS